MPQQMLDLDRHVIAEPGMRDAKNGHFKGGTDAVYGLKQNGVGSVHNPQSNMKLASGVAPVTHSYPAAPNGGQIRTAEVTAVWPSGARTTFWTFLKPGDDNVTTLARPANAPNLQADLDNAQKYLSAEQRLIAAALTTKIAQIDGEG